MLNKILVAYDGSEPSDKAFAFGLEFAQKQDAELHVLAVARPPDFAQEVETESVIEQSRQHCRKILEPLRKRASAKGIKAHFEVAVGHPAEQIIYHAEQIGVELIIMGHRGGGVFERWLIGSVAKHVMIYAQCSVMIAR
ncbi:universal stress protein [Methylobacter tundripaludum]|uniref:universal stress protein n=1 Tax=Methylobacter tundripaludum TaxID=173365 RepID=UPI0004DEE5C5|nr:universal stress protein [Methylobacter tundripaludum]